MKMNTYEVRYDYLVGGKYRPGGVRVIEARNKKEACAARKAEYWMAVAGWESLGYSHNAARRKVRWPFHIEATRVNAE